MRLSLSIGLFLALALPVGADTIHLRDGSTLAGAVMQRDAKQVILLLHDGRQVEIPGDKIARLVLDEAVLTEFTRRKKKLAFIDIAAHFELARWAAVRRLDTEARALAKHILTVEPDNADAPRLLRAMATRARMDAEKKGDAGRAGKKPTATPGKGASRADMIAFQVDQVRQLVPDKKRARQAEKLVRLLADPSPKTRVRARDDLLLYARGANKPELAEVAGKIYRHWGDYYSPDPGRRALVTTEFRAQQTRLVRPIPQRNISLGGSTSSQVRIQTPTVNSIGVNTTAIIPASRPGRR